MKEQSVHYRHCPTSRSGDDRECDCVEIERDLRAEWIDAGSPDEWEWSA